MFNYALRSVYNYVFHRKILVKQNDVLFEEVVFKLGIE